MGEARRLADTENALIQAGNDEIVDELHGKVEQLRTVALQVNQEVIASNTLLDRMSAKFDGAVSVLRNTHDRLLLVTKDPTNSNVLRMCFFCVFLFLILYFLSPRLRTILNGAKAAGNVAMSAAKFLPPSGGVGGVPSSSRVDK